MALKKAKLQKEVRTQVFLERQAELDLFRTERQMVL